MTEIENHLKEKRYDAEWILFYFRLLRFDLEQANNKKNFPHLKFYCDWCFHPQMDRQYACKMVKSFLERVEAHFEKGEDVGLAISEILDVNLLREEILSLMRARSALALKLTENLDWEQLIIGLFLILKGYPIVCKKELDISLAKYVDYKISGLKLVEEKKRICWEIVSVDLESMNSRIVGELPNLLNLI